MCPPVKGDLITFKHASLPEERGYVVRVFRSGSLTVERLHPGTRPRRAHVSPQELVEVHQDMKMLEQISLLA